MISKTKKIAKKLIAAFLYRELLLNLTSREIAQRYKQSVLGYAWVIINPLFQLLVLNFIFSTIFRQSFTSVPYVVFLTIGLLPWNFFAQSLSFASNSLVANSSLITKIYFPREILVFSTLAAKMVDFFYSFLILLFLFIIYKIPFNIHWFWIIPIFLIQLLFTLALSLLISAFNLFYRDIQYFLNLIITIWFYLTPIIYPVEQFPSKYRFIFSLNPMSVIINAYRKTILGAGEPNYISLSFVAFFSLILFLISFAIFKKLEGQFADYV